MMSYFTPSLQSDRKKRKSFVLANHFSIKMLLVLLLTVSAYFIYRDITNSHSSNDSILSPES